MATEACFMEEFSFLWNYRSSGPASVRFRATFGAGLEQTKCSSGSLGTVKQKVWMLVPTFLFALQMQQSGPFVHIKFNLLANKEMLL